MSRAPSSRDPGGGILPESEAQVERRRTGDAARPDFGGDVCETLPAAVAGVRRCPDVREPGWRR